MNTSMEMNTRKKQVVIIADSRGARLGHELHLLFNGNVHYRVLVKSGAKLSQLWETAESEILFNAPDLIFIMGSICDMTDRHFDARGHRYFWPPACIMTRVNQILAVLDDMANNAQLIGTHSKVCFIPEFGMDINKYNGIVNPIPWRYLAVQNELERGFIRLQRKARSLNEMMGIPTPRTLDITHSRRNRRLRPVYGRLYDGLHFSRPLARQLAHIINEYVTRFIVSPVYE